MRSWKKRFFRFANNVRNGFYPQTASSLWVILAILTGKCYHILTLHFAVSQTHSRESCITPNQLDNTNSLSFHYVQLYVRYRKACLPNKGSSQEGNSIKRNDFFEKSSAFSLLYTNYTFSLSMITTVCSFITLLLA